MIPKLTAIGVAVILVSVAHAAERPEVPKDNLTLACSGTMVTESLRPPGSRIITNGFVDFAAMRVRGFGIGSVPILSASANEINFGTVQRTQAADGPILEGTFNRLSGTTRIVVRSNRAPWGMLIAMDLDCRASHRAGP